MSDSSRPVKTPGADHPITVTPATERVVVRAGDRVVADTTAALALQESTYPVAYYVPIADIDQSLLQRTDTHTYCPYKGEASYYSLVGEGLDLPDVIWTYEQPHDAVSEIAGHAAFYANRVAVTTEPAAG